MSENHTGKRCPACGLDLADCVRCTPDEVARAGRRDQVDARPLVRSEFYGSIRDVELRGGIEIRMFEPDGDAFGASVFWDKWTPGQRMRVVVEAWPVGNPGDDGRPGQDAQQDTISG